MELVLISGFFVVAVIGYIASLFLLSKESVRKLWMSLFLVLFLISIITMAVIHFNSSLLASMKDMSELYTMYFVITFMLILGVINIWIFKSVIWRVLRGKDLTFRDQEKL